MPTLACVTMAYNEAMLLPVWLRYYGAQVGANNCFVIDHGSTDGSTADIGEAKLVRLERSPLDETRRAASMSKFCNKLLKFYDYVLFTDTDEIVVPDPERAAGLIAFVAGAAPVTTCIGLNLVHSIGSEARLDLAAPIVAQRAYVSPQRSMCKPLLFRREIRFTPGFHSYDGEFRFDQLFLFHLAWADLDLSVRRQAKRRSQIYDDDATATHHRVSDAVITSWMKHWATAPAFDETHLRTNDPQLRKFLIGLLGSAKRREHATYGFDMNSNPHCRWRIPPRFASCF